MCQRLQLGEGVGVVGIDHDFPAAIVRSQGVVRRRPGRSSGRKRQGARAVYTVVEGQRAGHAVQTSRLINRCIGNAQLHVGVTRVDDVDRHLPGHAVAVCVRHGVVESFGHVAIGIVYRGRGCVDQMTRTIDHQGAALVARSKRQTTGTVCSIVDAQYSHRRTQILGRAFGNGIGNRKIAGRRTIIFHDDLKGIADAAAVIVGQRRRHVDGQKIVRIRGVRVRHGLQLGKGVAVVGIDHNLPTAVIG